MKDIERYIRENKDLLNQQELPPAFVWDQVEKEMGYGQKNDNQRIWPWKIAAGILLLISVSLAIVLYQDRTEPLATLSDISPEYAAIERNYRQDIASIQASIPREVWQSERFQWVNEELQYLDKVNQKFLNDLNAGFDQDKVVRALIDHYEKKLKLLKRIKLEINRSKNETESDITT
jgi:hypothetical protein